MTSVSSDFGNKGWLFFEARSNTPWAIKVQPRGREGIGWRVWTGFYPSPLPFHPFPNPKQKVCHFGKIL